MGGVHRGPGFYSFAVTEVFPDGRVLLFCYSRVGSLVTARMVVYDDASQTAFTELLHITLKNRTEAP